MESGNRDTPRFVLKNRDEWQVCILDTENEGNGHSFRLEGKQKC